MMNIIYNTSFTNFLNLKILIQNKVCSLNINEWQKKLTAVNNSFDLDKEPPYAFKMA